MPEKILLLGGTKEAAELAKSLHEEGKDVTTSLAGRTKEPSPIAGKVRTGGFGGAEKMAQWLEENNVTRLIDATHPFAEQISSNAIQAARIANVELEIHQRSPWRKQVGDNWIEVSDLDEAASAISANSRIFLALGSQYLSAFANRNDVHFTVRMIDPPASPLPFHSHNLLLGKPSHSWKEELALLKAERITHIVCRNSGGSGAYAKIKAAHELGLPVIIIRNKIN